MTVRTGHTLGRWVAAAAASVLAHSGLVALLVAAISPDPVSEQPDASAEFRMEAVAVREDAATAATPEAEQAEGENAAGERLTVGAIRSETARASKAVADSLAPTAPRPDQASVEPPSTELAKTAEAPAQAVAALAPENETAINARPETSAAVAAVAQSEAVRADAPKPTVATEVRQEIPAAVSASPRAEILAPDSAIGVQVAALEPTAQAPPATAITPSASAAQVADVAPSAVSFVAGDTEPARVTAPQSPVATDRATLDIATATQNRDVVTEASVVKASLAWTGGEDIVLDPQSLAAIQSFMRPKAAEGGESVRDGLAAALSDIPCSRLEAAFIPETGGVEIRGHVPEEGLKPLVVERIKSAVGGSIPVVGSLLMLPAPQCAVLASVEGLGLPQSTDQSDDPLVVGKSAQAQILRYEDGEQIVLNLTAPEYGSYVYVDYYDAEGAVLHVTPNELAPLRYYNRDEPLSLGGAGPGGDGLELRIQPPYGQDIVVVLAATEPLYDGMRPLAEDAAGYLAWLAKRLDEMRAADPAFRGEWVYLFIQTFARGEAPNRDKATTQ